MSTKYRRAVKSRAVKISLVKGEESYWAVSQSCTEQSRAVRRGRKQFIAREQYRAVQSNSE
jgi:hypothetical protein